MSGASLRLARLHGAGDLRIETGPLPTPGRGELLLEVEAALLGGTARKVYARGGHARMGALPLALGHEGVGRIVAVGDGVSRWQVGQRVVPANSAPCMTCSACTRGLTAQCEDMCWLNGWFASHLVVPERIAQMNTFAIPDTMDGATAALAENLACVLKGKDRTPVRLGQPAVVIGAGPMGLLWTWTLSRAGGRVTCVDRDDAALQRTAHFGAKSSVKPENASRPMDADLIVEAVGSVEAWTLATDLARAGTTVHLFGGPPGGSTLEVATDRLHYDELTLTSSFHHTPFHFAEALRLLAEHGPHLSAIIEATINLEELPAYLASGEARAKVAVIP